MFRSGQIYESKNYHAAVFVGHDNSGSPAFASVRATKGDFKQDIAGSNKAFGFRREGLSDSKTVRIFESAIDLLSDITIDKMDNHPHNNVHRVALSGVSAHALANMFDKYPAIDKVELCLDKDTAGVTACLRIQKQFGSDKIRFIYKPPSNGKDYNEYLINKIDLKKQKIRSHRTDFFQPVKKPQVSDVRNCGF